MHSRSDLQNAACDVRAFLEPVWEWIRTSRTDEPLSTGFCIQASMLLKHVLSRRMPNGRWDLAAGHPAYGPEGYRGPDAYGPGGFMAQDGTWCDHHWVVGRAGSVIVDITADQFGDDPVIVTMVGDRRYCENISDATWRDRNAMMCCEWPKDWVPMWEAFGGVVPSPEDVARWMHGQSTPTDWMRTR